MGYNTTVVVLNDALDAIRDDPEFGKKLYHAILASYDVLVKVGGNRGEVVPDEPPPPKGRTTAAVRQAVRESGRGPARGPYYVSARGSWVHCNAAQVIESHHDAESFIQEMVDYYSGAKEQNLGNGFAFQWLQRAKARNYR